MKKMMIAALCCAVMLSGCGSGSNTGPENGKISVQVDSIPFTMNYNGSEIEVKRIELYQTENTEKYVWHPQLIIHIDTSKLTEKQLFLLTNSQGIPDKVDMLVDADYTSEQNDIKYQDMRLITNYTDSENNELVYIFYEYNALAKKDLSDITADVVITLTQDETYEKNGHSYNKENEYVCHINKDENIHRDARSSDELTDVERTMFEKGLARIAQTGF